jgi:tetratricopeptide (TPR) repeat protein
LLLKGLGGLEASLGERLAAAWGPFLGIYFRPLTLTTLALELGAGSFAPVASHAVSLGIFLGTCLALMAWLKAEQVSTHAATLAGAVFATLPLATEAVLWTSARGDLLVVLFAVLALRVTALRFPLRLERIGPIPEDSPGGLVAMSIFVALALLSKEVGVAVAAAVILRSQWPTFIGQGRPGGRRLWMLLPAGFVLLFVGLRAQILPSLGPPEMLDPEGADRVLLVLGTLGTMFQQLLWPFSPDLAIGSRAVPGGEDLSPLIGACGLALIAGLAVCSRLTTYRRLGLAAALCGLFLLPSSHLIPIEIATRTADRYLLLPWLALALMLGLVLEAARAAGSRGRTPELLSLGCIAVVLGGAFATWTRVADWQEEGQLLRVLYAEADSGNGQPALVLGSWLLRNGDCQSARPLLKEAANLLKLEGRRRSEAQARGGLADCLLRGGMTPEGLVAARAAVEAHPEQVGAAARVLRALRMAGQWEGAIKEGQLALPLYPDDPEVASELSRALAGQGKFALSAGALVEARRRAGISDPSALLERLREAEQAAEAASVVIAAGDPAGYETLAALAEDWGNPSRAAVLRRAAAPPD